MVSRNCQRVSGWISTFSLLATGVVLCVVLWKCVAVMVPMQSSFRGAYWTQGLTFVVPSFCGIVALTVDRRPWYIMAVVLAALCGLGFLVSLVFLWGLPYLLYPWGDRQCQIHMGRCFCRSLEGWTGNTEEYEVGVCQVYDTLRHYAIALIVLWIVGFIALVFVCIFHGLLQQRQPPTGSVGHQGPMDPAAGGHGFPEQGPYMANSKHFQLTKM